MRHNVAGRLFGRTANQRKALIRGIVGALIEHERVETTVEKAREARIVAEKLVTLGVRGDLHAKRLVMSRLPNRSLVVKLFHEIAPRFSGRNGGYLRIVRTRRRVNDRAEMAVLEFVDYEETRGAAQGEKKAGEQKGKKEKKAAGAKQSAKKSEKKPEKKAKAPAAPKKKASAAGEEKTKEKKTREKKAKAAPGEEKKAKAGTPAKAAKKKAAPRAKKGSTEA